MPGFNETGPEGEGDMTGRRMGCCTGDGAKLKKSTQSENTDGLSENASSRGFGFGRRGRGGGRGFGLRNRFRGGE